MGLTMADQTAGHLVAQMAELLGSMWVEWRAGKKADLSAAKKVANWVNSLVDQKVVQ